MNQDIIFTKLRTLIQSLITCEVIRGLGNGVPMPDGPFICMTASFQNRLSTNVSTYNDPGAGIGTRVVTKATQQDIQIDCYGPDSGEWASILTTMLRDPYACDMMQPEVQPLHADDAQMMPLVNGEMQYEERWMIAASFQINPTVTVPQEFADAVNISLISIIEGG